MALTNFSFVTVMEVKVFPAGANLSVDAPLETLTCLTMSNITQDGPRKEQRGGLNARPCIRYGKTARVEMEDVVMRTAVLEEFFGIDSTTTPGDFIFTETFPQDGLTLVGKTYTINKDTGARQETFITIHDFLPDGLLNITMEAEGDVGMISLSGELFDTDGAGFFTISETDPTL